MVNIRGNNENLLYVAFRTSQGKESKMPNGLIYNIEDAMRDEYKAFLSIYKNFFQRKFTFDVAMFATKKKVYEFANDLEKDYDITSRGGVLGLYGHIQASEEEAKKILTDLRANPLKYYQSKK